MRPARLALALALAATGCVGGPGQPKPGAVASRRPVVATGGTPAPSAKPGPAGPGLVTKVKLPEGLQTRVIEAVGPVTTLTGKVKLISDHGAALISNNGGGLVSNNGGGIIANNGGAFKLTQAGAPPESTLVDATVFVVDAAGRALVGKAGAPVAAVSDGQGGYRLEGHLPAENLVLKVRLWNGGELAAILPKAGAEAREIPVDTAATLGAAYVMSQFVKGDQGTFDKLPASEVERLRRDLDAARGLIGGTPDYKPDALVKLTDELRSKAPAVDKTLADIKALLLGQANLGSGLRALDVPLTDPRGLARMPDGALLIAEATVGRIRRVAPDGTITTFLDGVQGERARTNWFRLNDPRVAPDGTLYGVDGGTSRVRKVAPDGTEAVVAGTGQTAPGAVGPRAADTPMNPWALDLGADGTLYVGEDRGGGRAPRVFAVAPDGALRQLPAGPAAWADAGVTGLALGPDGALWALTRSPGALFRLPAGGTAWEPVADDLAVSTEAGLRLAPDGRPVVAECDASRVVRIEADGRKTVLAGAGGPAAAAELSKPGGLLYEPGGRLLIADFGLNAVLALDAGGALTRVAGQGKASQAGADGAIAVNTPGGLGFDSQGRMIVSDGGSHTLRRFDGKALETIAGGALGFAGDGGPAAAARFDAPAGLEVKDDVIWVIDSGNHRIRRVGPDGVITTAAGREGERRRLEPGKPVAPAAYTMGRGMDVAIGPDGLPAWTDVFLNQVHRLRADGQVELVAGVGGAGGFAGDGGAPGAAQLDTPLGLAYGPDGALYVADGANMRIRRVSPDGGAIETFCGQDKIQTMMGLAGDALGGTTRDTAFLVLPGGLCVDAQGNVYVGELGTASLPLLAEYTNGFQDLPVDQLPKLPARVRKIAKDGTVTVIAGPGGKFFADPAAGDALLLPSGLAIDPQGRLVIMDAGANLIRFLPAGSY